MALVLELQKEALLSDAKTTDLLRKAYVVARKLNIKEFKEWIDFELNGYQDHECPEYRKVKGRIKAWNPFNGWIPFIFEDSQIANLLSIRYIGQSIIQIENLVSNPNGTFHVPFPPDIQLKLMRSGGHQFESSLHVDRSQLFSIIAAVKNIILEWSLKLEENGILGKNMSFSNNDIEKAKIASEITIHNFQGVFGNLNNTNVSQNNNLSVNKNDIKSLIKYLEAINVPKNDVEDLEKILIVEKPTNGKEFGPKVNGWIGKMIGKANSGLWEISTGTAAGLLVEIISKFYGL